MRRVTFVPEVRFQGLGKGSKRCLVTNLQQRDPARTDSLSEFVTDGERGETLRTEVLPENVGDQADEYEDRRE